MLRYCFHKRKGLTTSQFVSKFRPFYLSAWLMREDLDRGSALMRLDLNSLGRRYLLKVGDHSGPNQREAMFFLKETIASARRVFLEEGYDLRIEDCECLATLLEKSIWWNKVQVLIMNIAPEVNLPGGTKDLLSTFFWESRITSVDGYTADDAGLITAGKALAARDPEVFLARENVLVRGRAENAVAMGCPKQMAQEIQQFFKVRVEQGRIIFEDGNRFQHFFNMRAQFVANGLISSELDVLNQLDKIKVGLRREFFPVHQAAFRFFGGLVGKSPDEVFERFFELWVEEGPGRLYA